MRKQNSLDLKLLELFDSNKFTAVYNDPSILILYLNIVKSQLALLLKSGGGRVNVEFDKVDKHF
jgi:hypothetical protein